MVERRTRHVVLDASALLTVFLAERGADEVHDALPGAMISAVNFAEVLVILERRGLDPGPVPALLESLGVETIPFGDAEALATARMVSAARRAGLSFGDCACLATGALHERDVLTADRAWKGVRVGVELRVVR